MVRRSDDQRDDDPRQALLEYLQVLRADAVLESTRAVTVATDRLRALSDGELESIRILTDPRDQDALGYDADVELVGDPRGDRAVELIDELISEVQEDDAPWG